MLTPFAVLARVTNTEAELAGHTIEAETLVMIWLAAANRFRVVVEKYQTTSHTPEALHRLVECYLALGIPVEARKAAVVLGANYPQSPWYHRAYRLIYFKEPRDKLPRS